MAPQWPFGDPDFEQWIESRSQPHFDDESETVAFCLSCGVDLTITSASHSGTCGHCLAYQFGVDSQTARISAAISGLLRTALESDEALARVINQLLEDTMSAVSREGYADRRA